MKKNKKKSFFYNFALWTRLLFLTVMAAGVSLGIYIYTTDPNDYKDRIISEIHKSSGVSVDKWGRVSWEISPRPVIVFEDVSLSKDGFNASLKKLSVRINLISLFRERVSIEQIAINSLNIDISDDETQPAKKSSRPPLLAGGGTRMIEHIPARELLLRNPILKMNGEVYNPQILRITIDRRTDSDIANLRIISGGDVYDFRAVLSPLNEERKVYPVRATLTGGGFDLISDIALEKTSLVPIDFKLSGNAMDLGKALEKLGLEDFPKLMPMNISATGGFGHNDLKIRKLEVKSATLRGGNAFTASGEITWGGYRQYAKLNLKSDKLVLGEIFPTLYGGVSVPWVRPDRPLNVFKDVPMPIEILETLDADLELDVGSLIVYRELNIYDIKSRAKLKDSKFHVLTKASIGAGDVDTAIHGEISDSEIHAVAAGLGERIYASVILSEIREPGLISRLPANFEFAFRARGANLTRIMSTASGRFQARSVGRGYAHKDMVSYIYGQDFLTTLGGDLRDLFRTTKDEDQVKIDCTVVNLKVRDGKSETRNGIAIESSAFNINVAGDVDLGGEKIRASMTSRPASGLRLSVTGDLISLLEFNGDLAEPSMVLNTSGLLKRTAYTAAGVASGIALAPFTGGASLAINVAAGWLGGNLLSNWLADNHPCKTAMELSSAPVKKSDGRFMRAPLSDLVAEIFNEAARGLPE